jgi:hypothetical protein
VKGTWTTERTRQYGTKNLEEMYVQAETLEGPSRQNRDKIPRRQRATRPDKGEDNHEWHRSVNIRAAIISGKQKNAHEGPI